MHLNLQSSPLSEIAADWLIVPVWENETPAGNIAELDAGLGGLLTKLREQGDVVGKAKELTPIYQTAGIAAKRLLLLGLGPRDKADFAALLSASRGGGAAALRQAVPAHRFCVAGRAERRFDAASLRSRLFPRIEHGGDSQEQVGANAAGRKSLCRS